MESYKNWPVLDAMPIGWQIDKTAGSPLHGHVFITNGKSAICGQQRALLSVLPRQKQLTLTNAATNASPKDDAAREEKPKQVIDSAYARTVNELARAKFKHKLLADILVDLQICEIEGWDKSEYIRELKNMINSIGKAQCIAAF